MGETHHKKGPSLNLVFKLCKTLLLQQSVIIYELRRPVVGLLEKERHPIQQSWMIFVIYYISLIPNLFS